MNIRHSSTGKRIVQNTYFRPPEGLKADEIQLDSILEKPDNRNAEALRIVRERIKQSSDFMFPDEPKFSLNKSRDTFISIFPHRSSIHTRRSSQMEGNIPEKPTRFFNHRADGVTSHRDAMIRASNLFKLYIPKNPS